MDGGVVLKDCSTCGQKNVEFTEKDTMCRSCRRNANYKSNYGITSEEVDKMFENQGKKCAICDTGAETANKLCVDHDHEKGNKDPNAVRGLLCNDCNLGLGNFKNSTQRLSNAIEYLKKYEENGSPVREIELKMEQLDLNDKCKTE